jgi:hypothetical protein
MREIDQIEQDATSKDKNGVAGVYYCLMLTN